MQTVKLLYQKQIPVTDKLSLVVPTVGEVLDDEDAYYDLVFAFTAMPIDMMVQLDDVGVDFTTINEWELFLAMFRGVQQSDTRLLFGEEVDLKRFQPMINPQNELLVLRDPDTGATIDRAVHGQVADLLRRIHRLEKNIRKPANSEAMRFMIDRARAKQRRRKNKKQDSQLESYIIALVNTREFKYDYESVRSLSIFQFNESLHQIIRKIEWDNRMHGIYSGTINAKELSRSDLVWLGDP